jgi:ADP-ribose pyrophosphatase YjhB (NUDIX family)
MIAYCSSCGSKTELRLVAKQQLQVCPKCDRIFFRNPKVVVIALIEDAGRVLLGRRDIEPGRGLWGLPGGYVDWDEHPEAAVVRECAEEMQVDVEPQELLDVQHIVLDEEGIVFLPYRARLIGGEAAAGDEVQEVGWFRPNGLPPLAFSSHRKVLQRWVQDVATRGVA